MAREMVSKKPTNLAGNPAIASHAHKRMDRMTVMALTVRKVVDQLEIDGPLLGFGAASRQAGRGSHQGEDHTDAAHNLPRDLVLSDSGQRRRVSFWRLAEEVDAHPRVKLQISYSAAATMTVFSEANYLDSRWEGGGLPDQWVAYLQRCLDYTVGTLGAVIELALRFKADCQTSLAAVIADVRERDYFKRHEAKMTDVIDIYTSAVDLYDPGPRLTRTWHIYQLDKYR